MPLATPQGTLDFKSVDTITFVGASSNTVIDTTTGSFGVGVDANGPTSNLHVVGDALITGNVAVDTDTLFVDSVNNRVGIGTSVPEVSLSVVGNDALSGNPNNAIASFRATTAVPGINDAGVVIGSINGNAPYIADVSSASIGLSFYTQNNRRMIIKSDGNVGIGTTDPDYTLDVNGYTVSSGSGTDWINISTSGVVSSGASAGDPHNQSRVSIKASHGVMSATGYFQGSDDRIKSFETELNLGLNEIIQLQPKRYLKHPEILVSEDDESGSTLPIDDERRLYKTVIDEDGNEIKKPMFAETEYGLISQHVESIQGLGILVTEDASENKIKNLNYIGFIPILINGMKELKVENDTLKARLDALENA